MSDIIIIVYPIEIIWLVVSTPQKNVKEFVSWDDDIPNCFWKNEIHVPNHQPDKVWVWESLRGMLWPILWESYDVNINESDYIMRRL